LRPAIAKAAKDRSTAAVAGDHRVSRLTAWAGHHGCRRAAPGGPVGDAPRRLGADETSFRRPGRFMSGLVDLDTGRLWDLFEGRSKAVLAERLRLLGDNVVEIESVVIDPYAGYNAAVRELAPHAVRAADRFHIERLAAQALTDVRCRLQQALTGHRGRKADPLYRIRRRLLASHDRLDHTNFARVLGWLDVGDPEGKVGAAYLAKELLRDTYLACSALEARRRLVAFDDCCAASDVPEFERLARTIARWETPILRWHHTRLTNATTEGTNLIVKNTKRLGFGFRNFAATGTVSPESTRTIGSACC
jgi:transposase